jgi:hypothetical protein
MDDKDMCPKGLNVADTGNHYQRLTLEPIAVMASWLTREQLTGFYLGNCMKYLARFNMNDVPEKGGLPDLEKASFYINEVVKLTGSQQQETLGDFQ